MYYWYYPAYYYSSYYYGYYGYGRYPWGWGCCCKSEALDTDSFEEAASLGSASVIDSSVNDSMGAVEDLAIVGVDSDAYAFA